MSDRMHALVAKVIAGGRPLSAVVDNRIYAGIQTGLDPAFIIDQAQRREIVIFDPACAPLIKPILRDADLRPWYAVRGGTWLIELPAGWTAANLGDNLSVDAAWDRLAARYPSLARHLEPFAAAAQARAPQGQYWWELPPYDYYAEQHMPRICWPINAEIPRWVWDESHSRVDAGCAFAANASAYLLGILASRVTWYVIAQTGERPPDTSGAPVYRLAPDFVARLPIPDTDPAGQEAVADLARRIANLARLRHDLQREGRERILKNFGPPGAQLTQTLMRWWELDFPTLRTEIVNELRGDIPLRYHEEWANWLDIRCQAHAEQTADIARLESELNTRVAHLFDLTPDDIRIVEEHTPYQYGAI